MKLRNIFIALSAVLGLAVSCVEDNLETLSEIQVSKSFICIPLEGGSDELTLNTTGEWTMDIKWPVIKKDDKEVEDKWFTPSQLSGAEAAKDLKITFTGEATASFRSLDILINCNGQTQVVKVSQGKDVPVPVTIAELLAEKTVGKVYKLTDVTVDEITNMKYGGMNISDATGKTFVYGTLDKNGEKGNFASLGINPGDKITIKAQWTKYGNLDHSMVLAHKKSLLMVDKTSVTLNHKGLEEYKESEEATEVKERELSIGVTVKGETINCTMPEWMSIKGMTSGEKGATVYTFSVQPFEKSGEFRNGEIVFSSKAGKAESVITVKVKQNGLPSSIQDLTIDKFLEAEVSETQEYRISGIIKSIKSDTYGNLTLQDSKGEVFLYGLTKTKVDKNDKSFKSLGLKVGDYVTVIGKRGDHDGPQMAGAYYESSVKVVPSTLAEFLTKDEKDHSQRYLLKGKVTKVEMENGAPKVYGNFTLLDEASNTEVYVYGLVNAPGYYLKDGKIKFSNNKSFPTLGVKEGDVIEICSFLGSYNSKKQAVESYLLPKAE